ncbi:hypothetical protein MOTC310_26470 [Methylobacterium oryzae]|uniref:Uncharacterized protein n=1 Tax=Methylobacterium oryzae TaxID=334852 RepID=A0ABU7TVC4_9HYPH
MSFTVVGPRDDQELEDAVRRGVADGLARLLGVPRHPDSVQAILDEDVRAEEDHASPTLQVAAGCARQA